MRAAMISDERHRVRSPLCIFFLTFNSKNLIKGTQPRSPVSGANLDVKGESIDEERNQEESAC
jgi:hypothetical protein